MTDRVRCSVPGCGRTIKADSFPEWICQKHWSSVPAADRRLYTAAKRRARRSMEMPESMRRALVAARIWRQCRDAAIETAMGIR